MVGCISPLARLTGLGNPKCENIRNPRALRGSASVTVAVADLTSRGCRAAGVDGVLGALASVGLRSLLGGAFEVEACGDAVAAALTFGAALPDAFAAAFVARCFSCNSLLSALDISFWAFTGGLAGS